MATSYTREWIGFFTGCGIPKDVATMYALIFYENRIQKNMLLDLNKEYLKDMGITVMGDVIAILRHSKIIHDKYVREQILAVDENPPGSQIKANSDSSPANKNSTPMKRILKHYTRKYSSPVLDTTGEIEIANERVLPGEGSEKLGLERPLKRKISATVAEKNVKSNTLDVHPAKTRRIFLEQEEGFKVNLLSGTTKRSKKLLEEAKKNKVKTVFERLGESSVSSTTSEISSTSTLSSPLNKDKSPSVFARLGEKTSVVSSTSCVDDSDSPPQDQLPYAGILKGATQTKTLGKTTMRADEQMQSDGSRNKSGLSVKKRLGLSQPLEQVESRSRTLIKTVKQTGQEGANSFQTLNNKKTRITLGKLTKAETAPTKLVGSTTQNQTVTVRNLKRSSAESSESSPSKKVRFGNISHRLIPANPDPTGTGFVKNYSKLTMTISNTNANKSNTQSLRIKKDSLISGNVNDKIGVKARVGNLPVKNRLGNRISAQGPNPQIKKISTVKDRLG